MAVVSGSDESERKKKQKKTHTYIDPMRVVIHVTRDYELIIYFANVERLACTSINFSRNQYCIRFF